MEWIQANRQVPKHGERVVVTYTTEQGKPAVNIAVYDRDRGWCWLASPGGTVHHGTRITHWQPLPEPPNTSST